MADGLGAELAIGRRGEMAAASRQLAGTAASVPASGRGTPGPVEYVGLAPNPVDRAGATTSTSPGTTTESISA